jgi:tRNA threonylcarbamoyladenosine biosynthesis protein TsaB
VIVLAFDTATAETVVGLQTGEEVRAARHTPAEGERPGHASQLLPLAHELLVAAGLTLAEVERIGVGVGPGSFTGLRIGVATARALAQGTGAQLAAIPTLTALAEGARLAGHDGNVLAVLDARRGEAFVAPHRDGVALAAPAAVRPDTLAAFVEGPDSWLAVGDGAIRFRSELQPAGAEIPPDDSPLHRLDATALCRLAASAPPTARDALLPEYVRAPDATPRSP